MGKTTDELVKMAYQVSPHPNRRELDMLLTTGERISMSLMSMALSDLGVPAISFTGSQAGVMTDDSHSSARILDVRPIRVREELDRGRIVVLAGFQSGDQRNHHAGPGRQRHHCGRHGRGAKSRVL
jgi:aspartate kinase